MNYAKTRDELIEMVQKLCAEPFDDSGYYSEKPDTPERKAKRELTQLALKLEYLAKRSIRGDQVEHIVVHNWRDPGDFGEGQIECYSLEKRYLPNYLEDKVTSEGHSIFLDGQNFILGEPYDSRFLEKFYTETTPEYREAWEDWHKDQT